MAQQPIAHRPPIHEEVQARRVRALHVGARDESVDAQRALGPRAPAPALRLRARRAPPRRARSGRPRRATRAPADRRAERRNARPAARARRAPATRRRDPIRWRRSSGTCGAPERWRRGRRPRCGCPRDRRRRARRSACRPRRAASKPSAAPRARVRSRSRETDAIAGSASPRKPKVPIRTRSSPLAILLVAWRSSARRASSALMPEPSSVTATSDGAALAHLDADPLGARVERVLDQLLHHRGGPLDDLAGRDLVDQVVGQQADARRRRDRCPSPRALPSPTRVETAAR